MTKFRGCIDLHDGKVKQIVGGTLVNDQARTNFVSNRGAEHFAELYKASNVTGCHIIKLGPNCDSEALKALSKWPGMFQIGGGITDLNCEYWIEKGASHVILTSYLFPDGVFSLERLRLISKKVGKNHLVVDLSCRRTDTGLDSEPIWTVTMNKWQTLTDFCINKENLDMMQDYCSELLIHAADVEGLCLGVDEQLIAKLGEWSQIPCTYAGGGRGLSDLELVKKLSHGRVDLTIGSALDIFGGNGILLKDAVAWNNKRT